MLNNRAVLCVLALGGLSACATTSSSSPAARGTSGLPDFQLNAVGGDTVRLSEHLAKKDVVVLAFWETWCEPCKAELPHLQRIYEANKDKGFVVLAISMDDPATAMQVAPYVNEVGFTFPVLLDPDGQASGLYNTNKTAPYTVFIGRDGKIASESTGFEPAAAKVVQERIEKLIAATP
ncbi:MAG: TlpA family protein disulfide reductase [Myxococcaceae bacterium]|nr:TlpA family protein disulfide reductase [Myxococcaceae bacterium]